ncbi:endonuclease domain-containing protein [Streptomyces longwoodensis]|uniref:endonuclease domain-containing protein n=1 Tax=Streptomyces longwoodensis TaxID=68231 RepID=UPI0036E126E1
MTHQPTSELPAHSALVLTQHTGEHAGAAYHPRYRPPARAYRCDLCPEPAAFWDHCHDHGLIRGPLCRSCNGSEGFWVHSRHGVEHLMRCPDCRSAGHPPIRNRVARILPTMQLLLHHYDPARHPLYGHAVWADGVGVWERVFAQLSAGYASAEAQCTHRDCGARWTVWVDRARFERLDQLRLLTGRELPGQTYTSGRPRWPAEPTDVFWLDNPAGVPAAARPREAATVVLPGAYARRLQEAAPDVLNEVALSLCWTRRGRAEALEITSDTVGLITLSTMLYLPARKDPQRPWTPAERRGLDQASARIRGSLHALTSGR